MSSGFPEETRPGFLPLSCFVLLLLPVFLCLKVSACEITFPVQTFRRVTVLFMFNFVTVRQKPDVLHQLSPHVVLYNQTFQTGARYELQRGGVRHSPDRTHSTPLVLSTSH